jgi:hypothetical protein
MSICKYCQAEINWTKQGERSVPVNKDGTSHHCPKPQPQKTMDFKAAEEAMKQKEAQQQQVKPAETCTSPTVPEAEEEPTGELISVTIGSTISLGNYSNVHLEIVATDAATARQNFRAEVAETVRMVRDIIREAGGA